MAQDFISVLIVDDLEPLRQRYLNILATDDHIEVVGQAEDRPSAVQAVQELNPDVILMDIDMDTSTAGLDATRDILAEFPDIKIIILTVHEDDDKVFTAFQLGVSDYVLKNSPPSEIVTCVKDAFYDRSPIRPIIAEKIRMEFQRIRKNELSFLYCLQLVSQLTQTEIDILDLLYQGYTRQEICDMRYVEMSTVKTQIRKILKKFDATSMAHVLDQLKTLGIFDYLHNIPKISLK